MAAGGNSGANVPRSAIVHTERNNIRDAVRAELKSLGVAQIVTPSSFDNCIEELVQGPEDMLVLDWDLGGDQVVQILSAARTHFKIDTRAIFLIATEMSPNIVATGYEYGVSQIHTGEISRARIKESLQAIIRDEEANRKVKAALSRVADARARGDWKIALPLMQELYEQYPENSLVAVELAEQYIYTEEWVSAEALLTSFIDADPPYIRALHLYGRCLAKRGKMDDAVAYLSRAKIMNPFNVERLIDLGHIFLNLNKVADAKENFEAAREIDGENRAATVGQGRCMLLEGDVNEALTLLREISGNRELAAIFNTTAILAMRHNEYEKGMSLYNSAVKAIGTDSRLQSRLIFNMALGYYRWGKKDKALESVTQAIQFDSDFAKAKRVHALLTKATAAGAKPDAKTARGDKSHAKTSERPLDKDAGKSPKRAPAAPSKQMEEFSEMELSADFGGGGDKDDEFDIGDDFDKAV